MTAVGFEVALIVALVLLNGVLAGSELALVSARKARLQQRAEAGDAGARAALELAANPNRFFSTVQVGITMVGILAGAFGGATLAEELAHRLESAGLGERAAGTAAVALVVLGITFLSLVIGELVPKRLAMLHAETIASRVARPMGALSRFGGPIVSLLGWSTDAVLWVLRARRPTDGALTEEEIRIVLQEGTDAGVIEAAEREIAAAVFQLGDRDVSDVMTPRPEVTWLDIDDPAEQLIERALSIAHEFVLVCQENADNVRGVVSVRQLLQSCYRGETLPLRDLVRPVPFVPETLSLLAALEEFKRGEAHLAVVVDEYGGTSGIVSVTDILEAIVGDLPGNALEEPDVVERPDGSLLIDGRLDVDDLRERLDVRTLPGEGRYQTLAGFVLHQLGHIPSVGERFAWDGRLFEVVDLDGNRVDRVLVSRIAAPSEGDEHPAET